ncbi:hypothetical protein bcere0014_54260 [Bacillus cereus BDRD-ST196]|nr:hypothetical protein bcere0014_54260 [Bacillus cereus BDRD-ST196]
MFILSCCNIGGTGTAVVAPFFILILMDLVARFNCKIIRSIRSNVACAGSCTKTRKPSRIYPLPYITAHPEFTEVFMPLAMEIIFKLCKYPFTTPVPKNISNN